MLPRRQRARLAFGTVLLTSTAMLAVACGLSVTGSESSPSTPPPNPEASLPGRGDANFDGPNVPGDAGDADAPTPARCASERGPSMVPIGDPDGGFCIDSTEVTVSQYKAFVDAFMSGLFTGDAGCTVADVAPRDDAGGGPADFPVTSVPWCEARTYCAWAGKHLCTGGASGEWVRACTADNTRLFPYGGDASVPGRCNSSSAQLENVRTRDGSCSGGDGLFDMVGNAAEWVDTCSGGSCDARGGAFPSDGTCATFNSFTATAHSSNLGFRCCR